LSARKAALRALESVRRGGKWSDAAIAEACSKLDKRDSALCAQLCYGVLQNTEFCDHYIDLYSSVKCADLQPKVLDLLRISVYQILFLTKIPQRAAVNEAVSLCKSGIAPRASGLVNAVLRRVCEASAALPEIPREDERMYLSTLCSHPLPLVELLLREYDSAFVESFLRANNAPTPIYLQVNTCRTHTETLLASFASHEIAAKRHPWLPDCIVISGGDVTALPGFAEGLFYVQDPAAKLALMAAGARLGMCVLDACAAPGGKTMAAAIAMENSGSILSCDIQEKKLGRIRESAERLGFDIVNCAAMDARKQPEAHREAFDLVLADVPCSGLGVIRKKPEIRRKPLHEIDGLPAIQLGILRALANCVKPGGVLLYSTCTVRRSENEEIIARFLSENDSFTTESFELPAPECDCTSGMVTLWPHIHDTDGFFICKLRRAK